MKNIFLIIFLLVTVSLWSQAPLLFSSRLNVTNVTGSDPYTLTGVVQDELSLWSAADINATADSIYHLEGSDLLIYRITSISSAMGNNFVIIVDDIMNSGILPSTGTEWAAIEFTTNYQFPTYIGNLSSPFKAVIDNRFKQRLGTKIGNLQTWSGVADGATNLGTMAQGTQYPDNLTVKVFADSTDAKLGRVQPSIATLPSGFAITTAEKIASPDSTYTFQKLTNQLVDSVGVAYEGAELVTNGGFSGFGSWAGTNWSASGGGALHTAGSTAKLVQSSIVLQKDSTYVLSYTLSSRTAGYFFPYLGGAYAGGSGGNGSYVSYLTPTQTDTLFFAPTSDFDGILDNVSVKKLTGLRLTIDAKTYFRSPIVLESGTIEVPSNANIGIGNNTLRGSTYDTYNTPGTSVAIGTSAGNDGSVTVVGYEAGTSNQRGGVLTAMGKWAGRANTTGHASLFGNAAGRSNTTSQTHAFGDEAAATTTTVDQSAFGYYALNLASAAPMSGFGYQVLMNATSGRNTAMGYNAARTVSTGKITGMGNELAQYLSTGDGIFIGDNAGTKPGDSDYSYKFDTKIIVIGDSSWKATTSPITNVISIGHGLQPFASNQVLIGNSSNLYNTMYGQLGLGQNPDALMKIDALSNIDNYQWIRLRNTNTGVNAASALDLTTNASQFSIVKGPAHVTLTNNQSGAYFKFVQPDTYGFQWSVNGANRYYMNSVGLGVGVASPREIVDAAGNLHMLNTAVDGVVNSMIGYVGATPRATSSAYDAGRIEFRTAVDTYYRGEISFNTSSDFSSVTPTEKMRILYDGKTRLNSYTATSSFPGTSVGLLGFDASGNITSDGFGDLISDISPTNEGALSVGAAGANTSQIVTNTSGDGGVILKGGTGINLTESVDTITINGAISTLSSTLAIGSALSMTTATPLNIDTLVLTAGTWIVSGNVNFSESAATTTEHVAGITTTSTTIPTDGTQVYSNTQSILLSGIDGITLPSKVIVVATGTTNVYLVGSTTFSAGTSVGFGSILAWKL